MSEALPVGDGPVGAVPGPPRGPSLAEVLACRGSLSAGEVVTLVVPLTRALASLHRRGVSIVGLDASSVWLEQNGRPLLRPIVEGAAPDGSDVVALAELAAGILDHGSVGASQVAAALEAAVAGRSDAEGLETALLRATLALPIAVPAPTAAAPRRRVPQLGRARPIVAVLVVALVAVGLGGLWGRHDGGDAVFAAAPPAERATSSPSASAPAPSWLTVMAALERARARAYATGNVVLLDAVYAKGSRVGSADRRLLSRLAGRKERVVGLRTYVQHADVVTTGGRRVTLQVADALTSYDVIGPDGRVQRHGLGRPASDWRVTLVRTGAGWRIWSISGE